MLNYKVLDHSDDFGREVIGVLERFVDKARRIDGEIIVAIHRQYG